MAIKLPNKKILNNLPEQVGVNAKNIKYIADHAVLTVEDAGNLNYVYGLSNDNVPTRENATHLITRTVEAAPAGDIADIMGLDSDGNFVKENISGAIDSQIETVIESAPAGDIADIMGLDSDGNFVKEDISGAIDSQIETVIEAAASGTVADIMGLDSQGDFVKETAADVVDGIIESAQSGSIVDVIGLNYYGKKVKEGSNNVVKYVLASGSSGTIDNFIGFNSLGDIVKEARGSIVPSEKHAYRVTMVFNYPETTTLVYFTFWWLTSTATAITTAAALKADMLDKGAISGTGTFESYTNFAVFQFIQVTNNPDFDFAIYGSNRKLEVNSETLEIGGSHLTRYELYIADFDSINISQIF